MANGLLSGRNMDFHVDGGLILLNPSGVTKVGFPTKIDMSGFKPLKWTSRYPSLTFSLFAREFPSSGINGQGLVVNEMTLRESVYPAEDGRPSLVPLAVDSVSVGQLCDHRRSPRDE